MSLPKITENEILELTIKQTFSTLSEIDISLNKEIKENVSLILDLSHWYAEANRNKDVISLYSFPYSIDLIDQAFKKNNEVDFFNGGNGKAEFTFKLNNSLKKEQIQNFLTILNNNIQSVLSKSLHMKRKMDE
jgi:hypothetical protein